MKINYCDALVIGGGLAGLRAAVATQKKGLSTIVLSLVPVKRSHSAAAQGGMQASVGNAKMSDGDNEDLHFADTVKGSDWGCDQVVARMFVHFLPLQKWFQRCLLLVKSMFHLQFLGLMKSATLPHG